MGISLCKDYDTELDHENYKTRIENLEKENDNLGFRLDIYRDSFLKVINLYDNCSDCGHHKKKYIRITQKLEESFN